MNFRLFLENDMESLINAVIEDPRDLPQLSILGDFFEEQGMTKEAYCMHNADNKIFHVMQIREMEIYTFDDETGQYDNENVDQESVIVLNELMNWNDLITYIQSKNPWGIEPETISYGTITRQNASNITLVKHYDYEDSYIIDKLQITLHPTDHVPSLIMWMIFKICNIGGELGIKI
jgi:hypothetical protein